jgi:hypothetical protein
MEGPVTNIAVSNMNFFTIYPRVLLDQLLRGPAVHFGSSFPQLALALSPSNKGSMNNSFFQRDVGISFEDSNRLLGDITISSHAKCSFTTARTVDSKVSPGTISVPQP